MSVIGAVKELLQRPETGSESKKNRPRGSYWCDDCDVRIVDLEVDGNDPPRCPECGDEMRYERSGPGHCAC